jgi:hypothetical protein
MRKWLKNHSDWFSYTPFIAMLILAVIELLKGAE